MGLKVPDFCVCIPWRIASLIVGIGMLVFSLMNFINFLVWSIVYAHVDYDEQGNKRILSNSEALIAFAEMLSYNYDLSIELMYSIFLVYGSLTENSFFICSWLISQAVELANLLLYGGYYLEMMDFEFAVIIALVLVAQLTVFGFYIELKKPRIQ